MKNRGAHNHSSGFTLVELLVALIVLALLAMIAVPSLIDTVLRNRVSTQANELLGLVQFSRSEAVKRRSQVNVTTNAASTTGWSASSTLDEDDSLLRNLDRSSSRISINGSGDFSFNALGRREPVGTHCIQLSQNGHSKFIRIGHSGQSRIQDNADNCP